MGVDRPDHYTPPPSPLAIRTSTKSLQASPRLTSLLFANLAQTTGERSNLAEAMKPNSNGLNGLNPTRSAAMYGSARQRVRGHETQLKWAGPSMLVGLSDL